MFFNERRKLCEKRNENGVSISAAHEEALAKNIRGEAAAGGWLALNKYLHRSSDIKKYLQPFPTLVSMVMRRGGEERLKQTSNRNQCDDG